MSFLNFDSASEIAALISGLLFYSRYKNSPLKWALPFLIFIVFVESIGWYISRKLVHSNGTIYNFSIPIEYCFYYFLFNKYIVFKKIKNIMAVALTGFIFFCVSNFLIHGIDKFIPSILLTGNCLMIAYCCFYFWQLFQIEEEIPLFKIRIFWVFTGVFLFNLGELSYSLFAEIMIEKIDKYALFFRLMTTILNMVLYSCYIAAFSIKNKVDGR